MFDDVVKAPKPKSLSPMDGISQVSEVRLSFCNAWDFPSLMRLWDKKAAPSLQDSHTVNYVVKGCQAGLLLRNRLAPKLPRLERSDRSGQASGP